MVGRKYTKSGLVVSWHLVFFFHVRAHDYRSGSFYGVECGV